MLPIIRTKKEALSEKNKQKTPNKTRNLIESFLQIQEDYRKLVDHSEVGLTGYRKPLLSVSIIFLTSYFVKFLFLFLSFVSMHLLCNHLVHSHSFHCNQPKARWSVHDLLPWQPVDFFRFPDFILISLHLRLFSEEVKTHYRQEREIPCCDQTSRVLFVAMGRESVNLHAFDLHLW